MITEEIWKDIPGYEGLYQASNLVGISKHSSEISQALKTNKTAYGFTWQEV